MISEFKALKLLEEQLYKEQREAGFPCDYCVNESLYWTIQKLREHLGLLP